MAATPTILTPPTPNLLPICHYGAGCTFPAAHRQIYHHMDGEDFIMEPSVRLQDESLSAKTVLITQPFVFGGGATNTGPHLIEATPALLRRASVKLNFTTTSFTSSSASTTSSSSSPLPISLPAAPFVAKIFGASTLLPTASSSSSSSSSSSIDRSILYVSNIEPHTQGTMQLVRFVIQRYDGNETSLRSLPASSPSLTNLVTQNIDYRISYEMNGEEVIYVTQFNNTELTSWSFDPFQVLYRFLAQIRQYAGRRSGLHSGIVLTNIRFEPFPTKRQIQSSFGFSVRRPITVHAGNMFQLWTVPQYRGTETGVQPPIPAHGGQWVYSSRYYQIRYEIRVGQLLNSSIYRCQFSPLGRSPLPYIIQLLDQVLQDARCKYPNRDISDMELNNIICEGVSEDIVFPPKSETPSSLISYTPHPPATTLQTSSSLSPSLSAITTSNTRSLWNPSPALSAQPSSQLTPSTTANITTPSVQQPLSSLSSSSGAFTFSSSVAAPQPILETPTAMPLSTSPFSLDSNNPPPTGVPRRFAELPTVLSLPEVVELDKILLAETKSTTQRSDALTMVPKHLGLGKILGPETKKSNFSSGGSPSPVRSTDPFSSNNNNNNNNNGISGSLGFESFNFSAPSDSLSVSSRQFELMSRGEQAGALLAAAQASTVPTTTKSSSSSFVPPVMSVMQFPSIFGFDDRVTPSARRQELVSPGLVGYGPPLTSFGGVGYTESLHFERIGIDVGIHPACLYIMRHDRPIRITFQIPLDCMIPLDNNPPLVTPYLQQHTERVWRAYSGVEHQWLIPPQELAEEKNELQLQGPSVAQIIHALHDAMCRYERYVHVGNTPVCPPIMTNVEIEEIDITDAAVNNSINNASLSLLPGFEPHHPRPLLPHQWRPRELDMN